MNVNNEKTILFISMNMRLLKTLILLFFFTALSPISDLFAQGDLDYGIFYGYQGWHLAPGDGRTEKSDEWYHWFDDNDGHLPPGSW